MEIQFWAATDVGRVREHNEDNFLVDKRLRLFVVCDGMGGHAAGEVASAMCVKLVRESLSAHRELIEYVHATPQDGDATRQLNGVLEQSIKDASARVFESALEDESRRGMGTTCVLLLLAGDRGYIAHVGDSRIYLLRGGDVHQMTEDHSLYNEMVRLGKIRPGDPVNLPNKNAVTRAVGVREHVEVDVVDFELYDDDRFLLCSDGLCGYFSNDDQIGALLGEPDIRTATEQCISFALESGGRDNVTAIIVNVETVSDPILAVEPVHDERLTEALNASPFFQYLSPREQGALLDLFQTRHYRDGEVLAAPGDDLSDLSLLLEGCVELTTAEHLPLKTLQRGDYIGELGFVDALPSEVRLVADGEVHVATLGRKQILDLLRHDPELSVKLLWNMLQVFAGQLRAIPIYQLLGVDDPFAMPSSPVTVPSVGSLSIPATSVDDPLEEDLTPPSARLSLRQEERVPPQRGDQTLPPPGLRIGASSPVNAGGSIASRLIQNETMELDAPDVGEMWGFEATMKGSVSNLSEETEIPNRASYDDEPDEDLRATMELSQQDIVSFSPPRAQPQPQPVRVSPPAAKPSRVVPPIGKAISGEGQTLEAAPEGAAPAPGVAKPQRPAPIASTKRPAPARPIPAAGSSLSLERPAPARPVGSVTPRAAVMRRQGSHGGAHGAEPSTPISSVGAERSSSQDEGPRADPLAKTMQVSPEEFERIKASQKSGVTSTPPNPPHNKHSDER